MIGDPQRLGNDGQTGIDCGRRRKKRRIDDEEILHIVRPAVRVEHRLLRIRTEYDRPALVGRVLFLVRKRHHDPESESFEHPANLSHQPCMCPLIVRSVRQTNVAIRVEGDPILETR